MSAYDDIILDSNPMAYYPLQVDGTDASGNAVVLGTANGTPTFVTKNMNWAGSECLDTSAYSNAALFTLDKRDLPSPILCVEVWFKPAANGTFSAVIGLGATDIYGDDRSYLSTSIGGMLRLSVGANPIVVSSATNPYPGTTAPALHYLIQFEGGETRVYVNGVLDPDCKWASDLLNVANQVLIIPGAYALGGGQRCNAYTSHYAVYDHILNQQERDDRVAYYLDNDPPVTGPPPPSILQEKLELHAISATTDTTTYASPTTAGNILVSCLGIDKASGAITPPPGWTRITTDETIYTVSGSMAYKVADGTETNVVWSWANSKNSNAIWIAEIENANLLDVSKGASSDDAVVNIQTTGTTPPNTTQPAIAIAMWATDSATSNDDGVQTVSQGFTPLYMMVGGGIAGRVGLAIATKDITDLAAVESTYETTDGGDAMFGKVAVFVAGEVIPPIDIDGAITLPALTLAGTLDIIPPIDIDGAVTLPALTLSGTMDISAPPIDIDGAITLPALTLSGAMDTFIVPVDIDGAITLPALTLSGTMDTFIPSITALQVTVSGLQAETTYNIKVRADSEDATSLWTEAQLTTPAEVT